MGHQNQNLKLENAEDIPIRSIPRKRDYKPVSVNTQMDELVAAAMTQNFVPVLDDKKELYRFGKSAMRSFNIATTGTGRWRPC